MRKMMWSMLPALIARHLETKITPRSKWKPNRTISSYTNKVYLRSQAPNNDLRIHTITFLSCLQQQQFPQRMVKMTATKAHHKLMVHCQGRRRPQMDPIPLLNPQVQESSQSSRFLRFHLFPPLMIRKTSLHQLSNVLSRRQRCSAIFKRLRYRRMGRRLRGPLQGLNLPRGKHWRRGLKTRHTVLLRRLRPRCRS